MVAFPLDREGWALFRDFGKLRLRAVRIDVKGSVTDTDGHLVREAHAEGGVKFRPKLRDFATFTP